LRKKRKEQPQSKDPYPLRNSHHESETESEHAIIYGISQQKLSATFASHAQTFSVVYNFGSQLNDPIQPF